jgi:acetylornithine deacetylase
MSERTDELLSLARKLISIPSLTGDEGALADFLAGHLAGRGLDVREQVVDGRRRNILALAGPVPRLLLCTHQDTVPPLLPVSEDDEYLYGRGACDAKGIMAVMVRALLELEPSARSACGLLFLVGEETDSVGAEAANRLDVRSDFIIVGEPTENKLGSGHKGFIIIRVLARGRTAHSGYPQAGESAVLKLLDVLQRLRGLKFGEDRVMGPATLNIGRLQGGVAANVVPDHAWAEVEVLTVSEPQRLHTVPGFETAVLSYGTDIPHLRVFGRPLLLGPGSILEAHTDRERISKTAMETARGLYQRLIRELLRPPANEGRGR